MLEELAASGLVGHGGAWFPVVDQMGGHRPRARRRPVVIANGAEGEPASRKDALLLTHAPHLVLDGLALAASTLRAQQAIAYVPATSLPVVAAALAERRARRIDPIDIEVFEAPDTYIAGQETAVVNALGGRRGAVPAFVGLSSIRERGVGGRPTLVQNAETLAHVALIGRFGAAWFRAIGTPETPGTMLLTVNRPGSRLVVEAVLGSSLREATGLQRDELARARGRPPRGLRGRMGLARRPSPSCAVSEKAARRAGATLGAGVVALLPHDVCPLAEMADVVALHGGLRAPGSAARASTVSAELADAMERLAYGGHGGPAHRAHPRDLQPGGGAGRLPPPRRRRPVRADRAAACSPTRWPRTSAEGRALGPARPECCPVTNRAATRRLVSRS